MRKKQQGQNDLRQVPSISTLPEISRSPFNPPSRVWLVPRSQIEAQEGYVAELRRQLAADTSDVLLKKHAGCMLEVQVGLGRIQVLCTLQRYVVPCRYLRWRRFPSPHHLPSMPLILAGPVWISGGSDGWEEAFGTHRSADEETPEPAAWRRIATRVSWSMLPSFKGTATMNCCSCFSRDRVGRHIWCVVGSLLKTCLGRSVFLVR